MGVLQPPRQPQAPTLMAARCGGQHTHHLSWQPRDTRWALQWRCEQKSSSIPGTRNSQGTGLGLQIPTPGPGGPRGPGRPMLPWGPGKPCNGNTHIREGMAQPGPWLPLWEHVLWWDWLILGRLDHFGQPSGYWEGEYEYSHGCLSQVPLHHPVKNMLHQPNHPNKPATLVTGRSSYLEPGDCPAQMSLPPAQNFLKCGLPSSPQIWQCTIFPLPGWTWQS